MPADDAAARYLELLRRCLTREIFLDEEVANVVWWPDRIPLGDPDDLWDALGETNGWRLVRPSGDARKRAMGRDLPPNAETMIGMARMRNVEELATRVLAEGVPGDFVEAGVWRGGTVILLRAVLAAYGVTDRLVWACDSFAGLPEPDLERYPQDRSLQIEAEGPVGIVKNLLIVPREQVEANLSRYGMLDDQVRFVEGWFSESLPDAPIGPISLLRVDGDLYQSTMDALEALEARVSPGGYVIIDDYHSIEACRQAVEDYRSAHGIDDEIQRVDWTGVWWQKSAR